MTTKKMKIIVLCVLSVLLAAVIVVVSLTLSSMPKKATALTKGKAHVILLSGQSNATGQTLNSYLEKNVDAEKYAEYKKGYENVLINYSVDPAPPHTSDYKFVPVALGQGADDERFGPEIGIASYLTEHFPDEKFYIVKVSKSGSGIKTHWGENVSTYKILSSEMDKIFETFKENGLEAELFALCWMQGETDAMGEATARGYYGLQKNLFERLLDRYSDYAIDSGVTTITAGISDYWEFHDLVNDAKKQYAKDGKNRYHFDTQKLKLTYNLENDDPAHYDSLSMIKLGETFGKYIGKAATK